MEGMNVSFIILSLGLIGFSHCKNCDMSETSRLVIKECLKLGKIAQIRTFQCYPANSQGGCDPGERLVINRQSVCKATHCINNKDDEGTPCADGLIAYNGRCYQDGSKTACEGEGKGRRLYADLYGAVSCKCSEDLGYVEVNGTCYHEHFRGPCEIGQKLQRQTDTGEWECVQDYCSQGKVMWEDGRCYEIKTPPEDCEDMYDIKTKNETETVYVGEEENLEDLLVIECITYDEKSSTFENCAAKSSGGMCLAKRRPPKGNMKKNISGF